MKDDDRFLEVAREAAREAGRLLRENVDRRGEVIFKGVVDVVTEYDKKAQDLILGRLSSAFPDHGFLAEEELTRRGESDFLWIFDPLDGTVNFSHTFPVFCVSIALEQGRDVILGLVYDPMREETFWATKGRGSFLNGKRIRVSSVDDLGRSLLATGFPYDIRENPDNNISHFGNFAVRAQAVRRCGSAALDLCYVAAGRLEGFWELRLKPWDVAAGGLIVQEAGGRVSDFKGRPFDPRKPQALATNGLIHQAMMAVLELGQP
jgi:myo-inositol-1(or 4)-monophosphatase